MNWEYLGYCNSGKHHMWLSGNTIQYVNIGFFKVYWWHDKQQRWENRPPIGFEGVLFRDLGVKVDYDRPAIAPIPSEIRP